MKLLDEKTKEEIEIGDVMTEQQLESIKQGENVYKRYDGGWYEIQKMYAIKMERVL